MLETDVLELHSYLSQRNFPVRVSEDAGQYICEEAIFALASLRNAFTELEKVFFCHVPPYGTTVEVGGSDILVDEVLLQDCVQLVLSYLDIPVSKLS